MINDIWELISANPSKYNLLSNNVIIDGSDYGYVYDVIGTNEYLIVGTDKHSRPNFILFTNNSQIYIEMLKGLANENGR